MPNYNIVTDSCCDLRPETYEQLNLTVVPLSMEFRGQVREDKSDDSIKEVYAALRAGESAQTAAVNPDRWLNAMEPHLAEGRDVLVMAFSSGLSTTYQSAVIAAEELREKYPERTIYVVDTLCASRGEGLLVWYACKKRDEGMTLDGNGLQEHTTGVGLRNVIGRLRLFYNRDDVMEITSTGSGMGTEVAVFIPV